MIIMIKMKQVVVIKKTMKQVRVVMIKQKYKVIKVKQMII